MRVLPARNTGRCASRRAESNAGDGGATVNAAFVVLSFSSDSAGINSRASAVQRASVVLILK